MNKNIGFVGLDVDDKQFHAHVILPSTGETFDFSCNPNSASLKKKLARFVEAGCALRICYEAGYLGFSLYRSLKKLGFECEVIAPSLIPKRPGVKVKTDRLDAKMLCEYLMAGLLTKVHVPEQEDEVERDLIRSRKFIVDQCADLKKHIVSMCRRLGWDFKAETKAKGYWSTVHVDWIYKNIGSCEKLPSLRSNLELLMREYENQVTLVRDYNLKIAELVKSSKYAKKCEALGCFKGISDITAITLVAEIGDIKRFGHPKQLVGYAGMDVREYSSGGRERKFGITKDGNRFIRTAVIESCQQAHRPALLGRRLKMRRQETEEKYTSIADRCMRRLSTKSNRLLNRGKHRNKVKVAAAREMLGFIWEALNAAS